MKSIDVKLNSIVKIIIGTLRRSIPVTWLPVLSSIMPPELLRQKETTVKEWVKYKGNIDLSIHLNTDTTNLLKSRKSKTNRNRSAKSEERNRARTIQREEESFIQRRQVIRHFGLPRSYCTRLNRFREECEKIMKKYGMVSDVVVK